VSVAALLATPLGTASVSRLAMASFEVLAIVGVGYRV
jgi:hypothetical protein